jgi:hypothetical protein
MSDLSRRGFVPRRFAKPFMILAGVAVLPLGVLTLPLPIPIGLPLLVLGSLILVRHSRLARLHFLKASRRLRRRPGRLTRALMRLERTARRIAGDDAPPRSVIG